MEFKSRYFLAPLAGITDIAFRMQCLRYGAGLVVIPMINCNALCRSNRATIGLLKTIPEEKPKAIQLFGTKLDIIEKAAKIAVKETNCNMIDFNMGCPDKNVLSQGAGGALLKRPEKITAIVKTLKNAVDVPISIKIRIGGSEKSINALHNAKIIEDVGADMIIIHGRTVSQGYSGKADWDMIKKIKEIVKIPVVGNGDVWDKKSADEMFQYTGCDYIMVGRGALGQPWIFEELNGTKNNGCHSQKQGFKDYLTLANKYDNMNNGRIKQHAMYFTKGLSNGVSIRRKISQIKNYDELLSLF